jgi:uncharacterized protein
LGGLKNGLLSCAYQVGIEENVAKLPIKATEKQRAIDATSFKIFTPYKVFTKNYIMSIMRISIVAHPNSKKPRIEKDLLGTLHAYINAPPLEGKANRAIAEALCEYFNVKKSCVILISGAKSKIKTFEVFRN